MSLRAWKRAHPELGLQVLIAKGHPTHSPEVEEEFRPLAVLPGPGWSRAGWLATRRCRRILRDGLQLVFSFRFGRPEHRTVDGLPGLMIYRRGLALVNLGAFLLVSALLMAGGAMSGAGSSGRTRLGLVLLGEDGFVTLGLAVGALFLGLGIYYMRRRATDDVL